MLPAEYDKSLNDLRHELVGVNSVCLSTDCWTSVNMESYIAVTAHFITSNFDLRSALLECSPMSQSHTSANLAHKIKRIIDKFHLSDKVLAVVSDNASNVKGAIHELKLKHFGCFAHTLNLICQHALTIPKELLSKIKTIVSYFKRTATGLEKLNVNQKNLGLEPKKLVQEVSTRWNSTYFMLKRFVELKDPIKTTIALINKDLPVLTELEWETCKELTSILQPFQEVTQNISGEKYVTGSLVIPLSNSLQSVCEIMKKEKWGVTTSMVLDELIKGIHTRMECIENSKTLGLATLLDPRFKLAPFFSDSSAKSMKDYCQGLMAAVWNQNQEKTKESGQADQNPTIPQESEDTPKKYSIWGNLEKKISFKKVTGSKTSASIIELNRYFEEDFLDRHKDPLLWWKENQCYFPLMAKLVGQKFNMIGTSVPCERLFSKAGNIITDRRSRLNPKKVEQLLFLNCNA